MFKLQRKLKIYLIDRYFNNYKKLFLFIYYSGSNYTYVKHLLILLLDVLTTVVVAMNGVFKSPSLLLLWLKIFSDGLASFFCCCNTACLNVSSKGLAIIMVVIIPVEVDSNKFEEIGCPVDVAVVTIVAALEAGTEVIVVSHDGPVNEDITTMFCKSWNKPMSSQCLMNVFGVGSCCCSLFSIAVVVVVVVFVIIGIDVVTVWWIGVRSGKFNCCCCGGEDSINKGGCGGDNSSVVGTGDSGSGGAVTSKIQILLHRWH